MRVAPPRLPTTCQDVGGRGEDKSADGRDGGTSHTHKKRDKIKTQKRDSDNRETEPMEAIKWSERLFSR